MPTAIVTSLVKKIQQLSSREQQELRTALGTLLPSTPALTEEDLHRHRARAGGHPGTINACLRVYRLDSHLRGNDVVADLSVRFA